MFPQNGLVAVGCQPVNIVARDLEGLVEPALMGIPFSSFGPAAPANVENLPANPADLPENPADLPADFAAAIANLFDSFGLPVDAAEEIPANPFSGF